LKHDFHVDFSLADVSPEEIGLYRSGLREGRAKLASQGEAYGGWYSIPFRYDGKELRRIKDTAARIRRQCEVFIVIGIGGSYLGARACLQFLGESFPREKAESFGAEELVPEIYFAGQNLSGSYHADLLDLIREKEVCLCIISKSGTTAESAAAFALLKEALHRKYGKEEAARRIYAVTDRRKGSLREEVIAEGYESFAVPDDVGGRYSVLTPVGLLPLAVAGVDVDELLAGAADQNLQAQDTYAAIRNALWKKGKRIEIFESYEPSFFYFCEWLKQLFGESEGKEGRGIFPASLQFSTDLHSMGQFLQEGTPIFFTTILNIREPRRDAVIPESAGGVLGGKSMNDVNRAALEGVMKAHRKAEIPMVRIDITRGDAYAFGQLVYFFETACALSGYLSGVDPFDQPGVESYKAEMRKVLQTM